MNILITGGAGYIGSHITEKLVKQKNNVVIVDNLKTGSRKLINKKAKFFKIDINNINFVSNIIEKNEIDSVIHLAAKLNVIEAERKPKLYLFLIHIFLYFNQYFKFFLSNRISSSQ